jgi:hypothetical protein
MGGRAMKSAVLMCMIITLGCGSLGGTALAAEDPPGLDDQPAPLDAEKCKALWAKASPNGDALTKEQAASYTNDYNLADVDSDGKLNNGEWTKGCSLGLIKEPGESLEDLPEMELEEEPKASPQ